MIAFLFLTVYVAVVATAIFVLVDELKNWRDGKTEDNNHD